jgi:2-polyprenyl-6-methoxyphenol hydroxylase-like FAD-dependent oxidoreductase
VGADGLTATVVGGGIAGLASALALAQAGWQVRVLERAPAFGEVGAGLAITGNGMAALAALGLDKAVSAAGHRTVTAGFQDPGGRWLMRIPDRPELRAVTTIWGLHRRRLHAVLLDAAEAAAGIELVTGADVVDVRPGTPAGELAMVTWTAGNESRRAGSALVVAADGVRSAVRARLFPAARPSYSGSTSWRAVIADADLDGRLVEVWGAGTEFGALRVSDSEMYWYGYFRNPEGAVFADELAAARDRFADWAPWIRHLVTATPAERLIRHDVYHLPRGLPAYVCGRVVMAGDAAHAALPTAGQGAATALEDGVCVGRLIGVAVQAGGDLAAALTAFDAARRPRCARILRTSAMIARFGADLGGGWRQPARNTVLRLLPAGLLARAGASIVGWTPPPAGGGQEADPTSPG